MNANNQKGRITKKYLDLFNTIARLLAKVMIEI